MVTDLGIAIGDRVRAERAARSWTLEHLAGVAGISRRMLVNVEQGVANPSIGMLLRLSDALGIGLPSLVEPPDSAPIRITRSGQGAALWTSELGGQGILVAGTEPPDVVELWDWTLASGDRHSSEAHAQGTKELIQVREGTVNIEVGDRSIVLEVGDSVTFTGDVPHAYANDGDTAAWFSLAVYEPGVGTFTRAEVSHG